MLNNIPLYVCTIFCLSIHLLMYTWVVSTFWLLGMMLLWASVYKYLFEFLPSILLGIYPEVGFLDHVVILFLVFWGPSILFSMQTAPFYIATNNAQEFQFLHILTGTYYFLVFFIITSLNFIFFIVHIYYFQIPGGKTFKN